MGGHLVKTYKGHSMTSMEISKKCNPVLVYKLWVVLRGQPKKRKTSFNEQIYKRLILAALERKTETLVYFIKNEVYFCTVPTSCK